MESGSEWELTAQKWLTSVHIERWLRGIWPSWRRDDVRHEWDDAGHWCWIVPDFERGRSRVLGVEADLLKMVSVDDLKRVLDVADWRARIDHENLVVRADEAGTLRVDVWEPELDEAWFPDARGGHFVAYVTKAALVTSTPSARVPEPFLALHGATWSTKGPANPRSPRTYTVEELQVFLPASG